MTAGDRRGWNELARWLKVGSKSERIEAVHDLLRGGIAVSPCEPTNPVGLAGWEDDFYRLGDAPAPLLDEAVHALARLERDGLAQLEAQRVTAVLAMSYLEQRQQEDRVSRDLATRAQLYVASWIEVVLDRSSRPTDVYFDSVRTRDEVSYPQSAYAKRDVHLQEIRLFLFGRDPQAYVVRRPFLEAALTSLLPEIGRWMLRRYAFDDVAALLRGWGKSLSRGTVAGANHARQSHCALALQHRVMPRLLGTVAVGHFVIASQKDILRMVDAGVAHVWGGALATAGLLVTFAVLLWVEVTHRAPSYPRKLHSVCRLLGAGIGRSALLGIPTYMAVSSIHRDSTDFLLPSIFTWHGAGILAIESSAALFFGYLLQILWDDQAITDPL